MSMNENKKSRWPWVIGLTAIVLLWGFHSGHLVWSGPSLHLASYTTSEKGPTAEVHPEVLNLQASFNNVAELVKPAVVSISTTHTEQVQENSPQFYFGDPFEEFFQQFFGGQGGPGAMPPGGEEGPAPSPFGGRRRGQGAPRSYKLEGVGSGVIIDPDGLVLTNEHVVRDADQIKVTVYSKTGEKKDYIGRVVGKDARTDVAIVRIKAGHRLPFAALGDSQNVRVGDWAIAIGSPFNLEQTVTVGIISASRQTLAIEGREYHSLIQTDAAINRGNSGGPLLNIKGEVVGINTAIYAPTGVFAGIGFAIPINQAKAELEDLVHLGHVVRGWLGVELAHEVTPAMVKAFALPDTKGALVNEVMKKSPAEKAGLKRGDVIRSFDGKPVDSSSGLQTFVSQTPPKKTVKLEVIRGGKPLTLSLVLGERPESADTGAGEPPASTPKKEKSVQKQWLGARVVSLTPDLAEQFRQPKDLQGVLVVDVEGASKAEEMGLAPGDVIRSVNQTPTPDVGAFEKATSKLNLAQGVVLDVIRQGHPMYLSYSSNS